MRKTSVWQQVAQRGNVSFIIAAATEAAGGHGKEHT